MSTARLSEIAIYPVKGLSPQTVRSIHVEAGAALPNDRRFAIAHRASRFDTSNPDWLPKRHFVVLSDHERLAQLDSKFDPESGRLELSRAGKVVTRGDITTPTGRDLINQFLSAFLNRESRGAARLVERPAARPLSDQNRPVVSVINAASVKDLERVVRAPLDPHRFRGNLLVEGLAPWAEFGWVGTELTIGDVRLKVTERITRCAATDVDPATAERNTNIQKALISGYGHADCGVYAEIVHGGDLVTGSAVEPAAP